MVKGNPFETLKSKKTKTGRFTIVQDQVRVNGYEQPYDYLEIGKLESSEKFAGYKGNLYCPDINSRKCLDISSRKMLDMDKEGEV